MSVDKAFIHDLRNDLFIIKALLMRLNISNTTVDDIYKVIESISNKCVDVLNPEKNKNCLININQSIAEIMNFFPAIQFDIEYHEDVVINVNKAKFHDVLINIFKNSEEAGAKIIEVKIKYNSLIIRDDGNCFKDTAQKLNDGNIFTTKSLGNGIGAQSIRSFCDLFHCKLLYSVVLSSTVEQEKYSLLTKIKFP